MYGFLGYRQSAARISNPVCARKNVNKQRSSVSFHAADCEVIRNFRISNSSKLNKSVRKSALTKGFFCRGSVSMSQKKPHPARQVRTGHRLTFKKNRNRDEELLEIHKNLDTDNNPVITNSDKWTVSSESSVKSTESDIALEELTKKCLDKTLTQVHGDYSRVTEGQSSVGQIGLVGEFRGSRPIEEYDGKVAALLDAEWRIQESSGHATESSTSNGATGVSLKIPSSVSSSNSTAVSLGSESLSYSTGSSSISNNSSSSKSSHLLHSLDLSSSSSSLTKEVPNIPLRPTQLPLSSQVPSNLPPSNERTVIGRELTPPRKEDDTTSPQSTSNTSNSSRRNNRKPPPSKNSPPRLQSNVREEADGSEYPEDPEIEELSRLRCADDSTEVIVERENRRRMRQRRCADYPGLAFGSSIFSSDTMMRFNIIRNELHNVLNTQLKRVRNQTNHLPNLVNVLII